MCEECWNAYGSPKLNNEKIQKAVEFVENIYSHYSGAAGGHLHIVLDDWNLEDASIDFCEKSIDEDDLSDINTICDEFDKNYYISLYQKFIDSEKELIKLFKQMTLEERASVLYWSGTDDLINKEK